MEHSFKTNLKVGIFVFSGLVVILTAIFLLGADKSLFTRHARLKANFEQVQGLARGSVVSLSGVVVGNIEKIDFISDSRNLIVTMKVEMEYLPRIPKGSQVEIRTQGALGDKFIYIIPAEGKNGAVSDGETLEVAKATDILNILSDRGKETEKIFDIINEMLVLTKTINAENKLGKIIENLNQASLNFSKVSNQAKDFAAEANLGASGGKFASSMAHLEKIMTKIDKGQGTLGALVNDSSLHDQLKSFLGGAQRRDQVKSIIRTSIEKSEKD